MSTTIKPLTTLKGVFDLPKMNHRRDFLRENKLSLREMQRVTCKKQTTQQQQQQHKQQKHEKSHHQQQEFNINKRRSASQQRVPAGAATVARAVGGQQPAKATLKRSLSQQRAAEPAQPVYVHSESQHRNGLTSRTHASSTSSRCQSCSEREASIGRNGSLAALSRTESQDKQIQTEDIQDEIFLYDALKKCASQELNSVRTHHSVAKTQSHSEPNMLQRNLNYEDDYAYNQDDHEAPQLPLTTDLDNDDMPPNMLNYAHEDAISHHALPPASYRNADNVSRQLSQQSVPQRSYKDNHIPTSRSHLTHNINDHLEEQGERQQVALEEEVRSNFDNISLHSKYGAQENLSARSRHTNYTTQSHELTRKKSNTSLHKLGGREDIRLPRYLEREKREKEEQRVREMERDPHCPDGHYALPEQERVTTLNASKKKFQTLISELNHMPMTMETLRIRKRKAEIEKELQSLEANIRIFSKPIVYVKQDD